VAWSCRLSVAGCRDGALMRRPATMFDRRSLYPSWPTRASTSSSWRRHHRSRRCADAASRGLAHRARGTWRLRVGHVLEVLKMVHGGLRYLQQHEFGLVHQSSASVVSCCRTRLTSSNRSRSSFPCSAREESLTGPSRERTRPRCGCTTSPGGWRIGKRHRRITAEELAFTSPRCAPTASLPDRLTTTPGPTTPG